MPNQQQKERRQPAAAKNSRRNNITTIRSGWLGKDEDLLQGGTQALKLFRLQSWLHSIARLKHTLETFRTLLALLSKIASELQTVHLASHHAAPRLLQTSMV